MKKINYIMLNKEEFFNSLQGHSNLKLKIKDIPYYFGIPHDKEEHFYFLAYDSGKKHNPVVGMLELEQSPRLSDELWLMSISVHEAYRNQGIAKELSTMMAGFLKDSYYKLERSTPSEDGLKYIKSFIDSLVEKNNLKIVKKMKI